MRNVGTKLFLIISTFVVLSTLFLLYRTYSISNRNVHELASQEAKMALQFDLSIRKYIAEKVRPVMFRLVGRDEFIVETMSTSFVARSVFEDVRNEFPDFILKFSSDNPRNPANQAGPEELKIIQYFNDNPQKKTWVGEIFIDDKPYMARFNARRMKVSCLDCHGDPADAPDSLLKKYGNVAGFNRPVGEVIALDTVAIPMSKVNEQLWVELTTNFMVIVGGLVLLIFAIFISVRFFITNRLATITEHFTEMVNLKEYTHIKPVEVKGQDEISTLAAGFNKLAGKLQDYYFSLEAQIRERTKANNQLKLEIDEKHRTEKALKESEERYRDLFENSTDLIQSAAPDGSLLYVNRAWRETLGYSEEEVSHLTLVDIIPPDKQGDYMERFQQLISGEMTDEVDTVFITKDGREIDVEGNCSCKFVDGKAVSTRGIYRDVTQKKKMEEESQRAEKLESIGVLAGGIAHDFNNLLSGIIAHISLARMDGVGSEQRNASLATAEKAAMRAGELTQRLITFSKGGEPVKEIMYIKDLLKDAASFTLSGSNIKCNFDLEKDLWAAEIDEGQMYQVINNLVINARDAMPEGGKIAVSAKNIHVNSNSGLDLTEGNYIKISVADQGHGISGEILPNIFDPYFTTKQMGSKKGTGLGLSISYSIIKNHDGIISVESEEGAGTKFHIYLPAKPYEILQAENVQEEKTFEDHGKILVMDDEEIIIEALDSMLAHLGYQVDYADDGEGALKLYKKALAEGKRYDIVILDLTIPGGMGGIETIKRLVEIDKEVKAIVSSGYSKDPIWKDFQKHGFCGTLIKPYTIKNLSRTLHEIITGSDLTT